MKTTSIHYNNDIHSKQSYEEFAKQLMDYVLEKGIDEIILSVDDGDGDVWKYTIIVSSERVKAIAQIKEN
jgi:predicted ATP-grasp superfamily ATP-dependent carboligase